MSGNVYDFQVKTNSGEETSLEKYKGKVLLIVNTASQCGYTRQYDGLEKLYEQYKNDLVVLGFPCNQFGEQEPGSDKEIKEFCETRFNIKFPIFSKVDVNGDKAHPLFKYLKDSLPGVLGTTNVKWNFTKFLVDRQGQPVKRFAPQVEPEDLAKEVDALL